MRAYEFITEDQKRRPEISLRHLNHLKHINQARAASLARQAALQRTMYATRPSVALIDAGVYVAGLECQYFVELIQ